MPRRARMTRAKSCILPCSPMAWGHSVVEGWRTRDERGAALGSWRLSMQAEAALQPAPSPGLASCSRPVWDAEKKINHWGMGKLIKFQSNHFLYII